MPHVQNPSLGAGRQAMFVNTVTLTAAQIRALQTTPVVVVPAPGAGKIIVPFGIATVFNFGTVPYKVASGGADALNALYAPAGGSLELTLNNVVVAAVSNFSYNGCFPNLLQILPGNDNNAVDLAASNNYTNGPIATATLGVGGAGYAVNDTGTISGGSADATYKVLTIGAGGAVLTFQITGAGTSYATANGVATATGGAQPGIGVGFTVNITAVTQGDGTLKVVTYYQIIPVP
jgi:hypothetical protein